MKLLLFSFLILFITLNECSSNQFKQLKELHQAKIFTKDEIKQIALKSDVKHFNQTLDRILIPRVVGTRGHEEVFKYIIDNLDGWHKEIDEFYDDVPKFGRLKFKNIIATYNPNAKRYLVLACHYDSKYFENEEFLGAIDSAVPCAMLLNLASTLKQQLAQNNNELTIQLIFFDGEEAFEKWGPNDSIYGAKHLAESMEKKLKTTDDGENINDLDKMDLLVLLDLIGAKNPKFQSYFPNTDKWFLRLADIEDTLAGLGLLKKWNANKRYFERVRGFGAIEDDHIPFLIRNVPILHLITVPFPKEWHTIKDNRDIVDLDTVENINKILRVFIAEYLHLSLDLSV